MESAGPANINSLDKLKSAVDELKDEQNIHRLLHAHHALLIYAFVAWMFLIVS